MNKQLLKNTLENKALKQELGEDLKKLKASIDDRELEVSEEKKKFSLRDTVNKKKILVYDNLLILCMLFILITIFMLFAGLWYSYFEKEFIQFIIFMDVLLFILIGWSYLEECRQ
jgi:hypothetical protein